MPCYHPLTGYRSRYINRKTGKRPLVFSLSEAWEDMPVQVSCGQCIGCRLKKSRDWAIRCVHEASLWPVNSFITLTYNDDHIPEIGTLVKSDFQKFMKRIRRRYGTGVRYYACGEYGEKQQRPHYHACLFNWRPDDLQPHRTKDGYTLYTSPGLEQTWSDEKGPIGFSTIGNLTFESAAYVARYVTKKLTGELGDMTYEVIDPTWGEYFGTREKEFSLMSRRPGIGRQWIDKNPDDVYPDDFVVIDGRKHSPPKYYDYRFEIDNPNDFLGVKRKRKRDAKPKSTEELLKAEKVRLAHLKLTCKRGYENGSQSI